jgi:pimeloyl-ACP methyl ester carboxylesterase
MSTADVARDLDLLRQAVGDAQLNYLGFSYGSYIGNTYANLFPRNVRALVIDAVFDPRLWSSGRQIEAARVATQKEFNEFLRLCDEAGPACAFSGPEGSATRWEALATALHRHPLALPDGTFFTYDSLIRVAADAMYQPEFWGGPFGDAALFDAVADAVFGAPAATTVVADVRRSMAQQVAAAPAADDHDNSFDAHFGNHCADAQYPRTFTQYRMMDTYAADGSRFGPWWWWTNRACAEWPVNDDRYTGPWTARTANPVLVVGNYFDGITDYAGAQASARLLKNGRLLSYAGWGHGAYGRSACVTGHVNRYLLDGVLPDAKPCVRRTQTPSCQCLRRRRPRRERRHW